MKLILKNYIPLLLVLLVIASCKKFVDVGQPKNQLTTTEVFADSTDASATLLGVYINIMNTSMGTCSGGITLYPGFSSDELYQTGNNLTNNQFYTDNIQTTNSTVNQLWGLGYSYIYAVNACINGVATSKGITSAAKIQLSAEAEFVRGFVYFNLVNLYGGVPLVLSTDYNGTSLSPRVTQDQVYSQVIADLLFAETNLGSNTGSNDRPNSLTASALLAKVYLYQGNYQMAQTEAAKVINSGIFTLETDLNNVFLQPSGEIIWQINLPFNKYTWEGQNFVPNSPSVLPRYVLTPSLYASFENDDQRLLKWIKVNTVSGKTYPYPYKYKNNASSSTASENYVMLRLADQYLIKAEAEANQNDITDAVNDLNIIRNRAGLANYVTADDSSLKVAIQNERRHEYFCEWGNRWFDLKRTNSAIAVLGPLKPNWNASDELYPVPVSQINGNPKLIQNSGY